MKCCGCEMIKNCSCGQNAYCSICMNGIGQIPCECSSPWDRVIAKVLTENEELWKMLADTDSHGLVTLPMQEKEAV